MTAVSRIISWLGGKCPGDGSVPHHLFTRILKHDGFTLGTTHAVTEYVDITSSLSSNSMFGRWHHHLSDRGWMMDRTSALTAAKVQMCTVHPIPLSH